MLIAARSPMFSHLNATIEGLETIRACGEQERCLSDFQEHYDVFTGIWFTSLAVFLWFQLRNNLVSACFAIATVFISVAFHDSEYDYY